MTREVAFEDQAISQAADFLHDDPDGVRSIFAAVDRRNRGLPGGGRDS